MAAPNRNSVAILGQMLDEFKKQGVSQRVGTHSFGNQMRATLAAMRKTDEGWWSVKIRTEDRWNPAESRMEVVVSLLEQDTSYFAASARILSFSLILSKSILEFFQK